MPLLSTIGSRRVALIPLALCITTSSPLLLLFGVTADITITNRQVGMYHAIVRRRVVALFAAVSKGDARPVLEGLAPHFEHFFLAIMPSVDRVSRWRKRDCGTSGSIGCCQTSVLISAPSGFRGRLGILWLQWIGWKVIRGQTECAPLRPASTSFDWRGAG